MSAHELYCVGKIVWLLCAACTLICSTIVSSVFQHAATVTAYYVEVYLQLLLLVLKVGVLLLQGVLQVLHVAFMLSHLGFPHIQSMLPLSSPL